MKTIVFTGGGTGGHIYPGLAIVDELKNKLGDVKIDGKNPEVQVVWIGAKKGSDRDIVEKSGSCHKFYGVSSGKLRRYFSFQNFIDFFKIGIGFISSFFLLLKLKPLFVFSKGGFVSVPPVIAAKLLKIPVYTHECDFSPGLATRINSKFAKKILLSFESTTSFFSGAVKEKLVVTGNPVRPVFYEASAEKGRQFVGYNPEINKKPILLVMGGSLGAVQINSLVKENLSWLKENFFVVHQTGKQWAEELLPLADKDYHPFAFIYNEMPDVVACADVVFSRAGSNSLWECAVSKKPLVLVPFSGSGTRGDQVENAAFFEKNGAAIVLGGKHSDGSNTMEATGENLKNALQDLLDEKKRKMYSVNVEKLVGNNKPAEYIANLIFGEIAEKL